MRPDLATVFTGTNDVIARRFDARAVRADLEAMQRGLIEHGAIVVTFTLPDITPVMPLAGLLAHRVHALNEVVREAAAQTGALLADIARHRVASDPRLWSDDRLHANALGHERIAGALAHTLGLPGADGSWAEPLPDAAPRGLARRLAAEISWARRYLAPWMWRSLRGRSSGDGRRCRHPELVELRFHVPDQGGR
jgi:hypothetical protein